VSVDSGSGNASLCGNSAVGTWREGSFFRDSEGCVKECCGSGTSLYIGTL
jgi:hypothetical protein